MNMQKERDPVIVQALRTPIADHRGVFKEVPTQNLVSVLIKEVMEWKDIWKDSGRSGSR